MSDLLLYTDVQRGGGGVGEEKEQGGGAGLGGIGIAKALLASGGM